jgi:hypothetical protein
MVKKNMEHPIWCLDGEVTPSERCSNDGTSKKHKKSVWVPWVIPTSSEIPTNVGSCSDIGTSNKPKKRPIWIQPFGFRCELL